MNKSWLTIAVCVAIMMVCFTAPINVPVRAQYNCDPYTYSCGYCGYYGGYYSSYYNCGYGGYGGYYPYSCYDYYCYGTNGYQTVTATVTEQSTVTVISISVSAITTTVTSMYPTVDHVAISQATEPLYVIIGGLVVVLFSVLVITRRLFSKLKIVPKEVT